MCVCVCVCVCVLEYWMMEYFQKLSNSKCNTTLSEPFGKECQAYNFFCPISNVNSYSSIESCTLFLDV